MSREATSPLVAAVVVARDGGADLLACVSSLLAQSLSDLAIIVVDNASTDTAVDELERELENRVRVIRCAVNRGYAAGANVGWRSTEAPIVAILNQDLVLVPDCLERMRDALLGAGGEALVTPKLVLKADPTIVNAVGDDVHLSGVAWCNGLGTRADEWHGVVEVTAISGAAFMARRSLLESLGGLEEAYFMYMEDVDLSLRARLRGATCLAACDAVASHDWALRLTPAKFGLLERNRRWMWFRLWRGRPRMLAALVEAEALAWVYAGMHGRRYIRAKVRGYRRGPQLPALGRSASRSLLAVLAREHQFDGIAPRWAIPIGVVADRVTSLMAGSRPGERR